MRWEKMREPLWRGMQAFRMSWPEDQYLMKEGEDLMLFSVEHPEGVVVTGWTAAPDLDADDWAATGPSGE